MGKITKELIKSIKIKARELQRAPLRSELNYKGSIEGGYHNAVLKAGLMPYGGENRENIHPPKNGKYYTDEELLSFIGEYVLLYGEPPLRGQLPEYGYIEYRFGAWNQFMVKLGYKSQDAPVFTPI
ncbi:MAG: hypothetical protein RSB05_02680, partial [Clostridiales bacterium]